MSEIRACHCIGPQNGEPLCPCMMRGVTQRDDRWIQEERDLGPVNAIPSRRLPRAVGFGCICPPTSEKTCENQNCPRKRKSPMGDRIGP